ncbi:hypothetical protein LFL96_04810 [Paraburkholderia sp. D15]|uniref:hypothetical protein n=1 Tax=Paraburkholderia sp. D15 TaxID=2880218 RepID=UPI00247AE93C|nr:hypothetical protein [Paraburkholderia sp. D15]WGS50830.1 hypothetical protein LFL96_04810 [Paraburkholderia sp. D15]
MVNELSPICKALIALLSSRTSVMSISDINRELDYADVDAVRAELRMLVRADLIRQGIRTSDSRIVYWFSTAAIDTSDVRDQTLADVGEAAERTLLFFKAASQNVSSDAGDRRYIAIKATAPELLERAAEHMKARAATYDKPAGERSMGATVTAFNVITGRDLAEAEGRLLMQLLKNVRLFQRPGFHADSAEDAVAYTALMGEAKARDAETAGGQNA